MLWIEPRSMGLLGRNLSFRDLLFSSALIALVRGHSGTRHHAQRKRKRDSLMPAGYVSQTQILFRPLLFLVLLAWRVHKELKYHYLKVLTTHIGTHNGVTRHQLIPLIDWHVYVKEGRTMTYLHTWLAFMMVLVASSGSATADTCSNVAAFIVSTQAGRAADPEYSVQTEWGVSNITGTALTPWVALSAQKVAGGVYGDCIPQVGGKEVKKFWDHMLSAEYPRLDVPQRCWCSPEANVYPSIHIKVSECGQRKRSRKLLTVRSASQGDPGDPDPFDPMFSGLINATANGTVMNGWFLAGHDAEIHCSGKNGAGAEVAFVMWPQDSCWDPGW